MNASTVLEISLHAVSLIAVVELKALNTWVMSKRKSTNPLCAFGKVNTDVGSNQIGINQNSKSLCHNSHNHNR